MLEEKSEGPLEGSIYRIGRLSDVKYKRISEVEPQPGNLLRIEVVWWEKQSVQRSHYQAVEPKSTQEDSKLAQVLEVKNILKGNCETMK